MEKITRSLYPDFELTIDNCHSEPIHRPIAVHSHGYLLCFDVDLPDYLFAVSENVSELLGIPENELWEKSVKEWMPKDMFEIYQEMDNPEKWDAVDPVICQLGDERYNIIRHTHNGKKFLEIEPKEDSVARNLSTFRSIRIVTESFYRIDVLEKLYEEFAIRFKKITGYDRVMVYQFDNDYHGFVVGEARENHLEPYFGLHYPATDIPQIARDLFLRNRSRIIANVNMDNHWIKFNPGIESSVSYLDLTYSQLRATSTCHIEYLQNMGVTATLCLAIVIENKLWGLIACHNYSPYFVKYEMRKTAELIANAFAQRITEITKENYNKKALVYREKELDFLKKIGITSDVNLQLFDLGQALHEFCDADGFVIVVADLGIDTKGETPSKEQIIEIKKWLSKTISNGIFVTNDLSKEISSSFNTSENMGGLVAINIDVDKTSFIMWFRKPQKQIYHWGGDPNQPYEIDTKKDGKIRLGPRNSFKKWTEQVDTKSKPWDQIEVDMAKRIREGLIQKDVERQIEKSKLLRDDLEQLTYVASHDLQEPLRTVSNYISLIAEEIMQNENESFKSYVKRIDLAVYRMKTLVKDMLDYSRIGRFNKIKWFSINELINELLQDMALSIQESETSIYYQNLPLIKADRLEIKQLFQNMLSNAIKYRKSNVPPKIYINAEHIDRSWVFSIEDNGIGIEERYFDKIFLLFQRLHNKHEYDGTGIGLSQCKKIIDKLDGKISVTSKIGQGSIFRFSLHESIVKDEKES